MKKVLISLMAFFLLGGHLLADEGMWIPLLVKKYKYEDMKSKGFRLSPEDIYSINESSMKDAVVLFGRGCTGEIISDQGLLLTNHHCGYGVIQAHSTLEHDYLSDGYWAMNQKEELPAANLTVSFLVRMEDVTSKILVGVTDNMTEAVRGERIRINMAKVKKEAQEGDRYSIEIKPFYYGNEYYMFVYEIYKDIRLVGAPPSSIGKFGGDTDNWVWPRHTGDFCVFRIYAGKNNEPAAYSPENVPYKPKRFFKVSTAGVQKGDFTMVYGYPGRTKEYVPSYAVKLLTEVENPHQIALREIRLDIMKRYMDADPKVRIQYASKYASVANYWKKWIGENKGLKRLNAVAIKENYEKRFTEWVNADPDRKKKYGKLLAEYKLVIDSIIPYAMVENYLVEGVLEIEALTIAQYFSSYQDLKDVTDEKIEKTREGLRRKAASMFRDYYPALDQQLFVKLIRSYMTNIDPAYHPAYLKTLMKQYKGNIELMAASIYSKSPFASEKNMENMILLTGPKMYAVMDKDPLMKLFSGFADMYNQKILVPIESYNGRLDSLNRIYMKAQMEYEADRVFYPDANLTLRVTYGQVDNYSPADGVIYDWFTTLDGIMEKEDPDVDDYQVPAKLKELYLAKDYGNYGVNGKMPVAFTASNHTTGGNSGSPVLNGNGELIGINFDRNWEGTMSDVMYDPSQCRNIALDIRYILFIIDKFAGAGYLVDEMGVKR